MARDITPEEARDQEIAKRAIPHHEQLREKLLACDGRTIVGVASRVACDLTDDVLNQLVVLAAMDHAAAGAKLAALVNNALLVDAEVAATREVEQLEREADADPDNYRATSREMARRLVEINSRF